jgi:cob(I)alamin adenosyltransferase
MRFFSGKGDEGKTAIIDGKRTYKNETVFELLGTLDEVSANLGLAISYCTDADVEGDLKYLQMALSRLMGLIASGKPPGQDSKFKPMEEIQWLENKIEVYGAGSMPIRDFIQPGKTTLGAAVDISRTVARRAERVAVKLFRESDDLEAGILAYMNRLSSLLFFLRTYVDDL